MQASEESKQAAATSQASAATEEEKKEEEDTGPVAPKHNQLVNDNDGAGVEKMENRHTRNILSPFINH